MNGSKGSILVVEDDDGICTLERLRLERAGFQVNTASTAEEAKTKLLETHIEVLVLDNHLPDGVDGLDFYQHLQHIGCKVPVIMVTGFSDEATAIRAIKSGVRDFITKSPEFLEYLPDAVTRVLTQVRTEQALTESETRYRNLHERFQVFVERMPAIFFSVSKELRMMTAMGDGLTALDLTADEIKGMTLAECFQTDNPDFPAIGAIRRALAGEVGPPLEIEWRGRWFHTHLEPLVNPDGSVAECIGVALDITEQKQWQKHLLRSERLESLGTLVGGIAHDLNNVLTPIVMAVDLLRLESADPNNQALLNMLQVSAQRGADMVKQVLSYARGTPGQHQPVILEPLLKELFKLLSQTFPKSIEVKLSIAPGLPMIAADATQIHQVVMNLCLNARDAMQGRSGGRLSITADSLLVDEAYARMKPGARPGTYVILTVEDNGSGIPADIRDKIFDPFFTTKGPGHGSGLGLFNVVNIVRTHGGFLDFRTLLGKGTLFTIGLPCLSSAAIAEAGWDKNASTLSGGLPAELPMGAGEVVLVVDDEASIREIMRATLEAAGYQVLTASDGAEATALYAQKGGSIHAVIMDIMMPVMNGTAALNALHTLDPQVRAIVASGYQKKQTIDIPSFVKAILAKPFTASTLLKTVRQALSA